MGQILHGSARTTAAVRRAIQHSQASLKRLAQRYSINPKTVAVWGKNDPCFLPAGAEAYKKDNPQTKVVFYDTGHFALETHAAEIGAEIQFFLGAALKK